jgi:hypothetical protein
MLFRWTYTVEVEADTEDEAQALIEESVDRALSDPDGIISYGEFEEYRSI